MSDSKPRKKRVPNYETWPPVGYVGIEYMMAATGGRSAQTIYNWINSGLLPAPIKIGPNTVGWSVDSAHEALKTLPDKLANRRPQ